VDGATGRLDQGGLLIRQIVDLVALGEVTDDVSSILRRDCYPQAGTAYCQRRKERQSQSDVFCETSRFGTTLRFEVQSEQRLALFAVEQ
jgi:hypothetical protein